MRKIISVLAAIVMAFVARDVPAQAASSQLSISIDRAADQVKADSGDVLITYKNTGKEPIFIFRGSTPLSAANGVLPNDQFSVVDEQGQPVKFIGQLVKIVVTESSFIRIEAGRSITIPVNIPKNYDVTNGNYEVSARELVYYAKPWSRSDQQPNLGVSTSVPVKLWISPSLISRRQVSLVSPAVVGGSCSATQTTAIQAALVAAKNMTGGFSTYVLSHSTIVPIGTTDGKAIFHPDARFIYWFGYSADIDGGATYVDSGAARGISMAGAIANGLGESEPIIQCDTCPGYDPMAAAHTQNPTITNDDLSQNTIWTCPYFFSLPTSGSDSQAGTIIHELSHWTYKATCTHSFNDPGYSCTVGPTTDYVNGYGYSAAHNLAVNSPGMAVNNGDNYEYFFENTPAK